MGRRFLGSRLGDAVPVSPGVSASSAVYPMSDQYYIKQVGGWAVSKATGGTVTVPGDGYVYHQFYANVPGVAPGAAAGPYTKSPNTSGTFVAKQTLTCDVLIIGGGGSGGFGSPTNTGAGGGGAGAVIYLAGQSLPATTYPVTVGGGGAQIAAAPTTPGTTAANRGDSSIFNGTTAYGGGAGGRYMNSGVGDNGQGPTNQGSGGGGGSGYPSGGGAGGSTGSTAHPGAGVYVPSAPAPAGWGRAGGQGGADGSNLSGGGGGGGAMTAGGNGQSGNVVPGPGYAYGGDGGKGALYTIAGAVKGVGGGGVGGSFNTAGTRPAGNDSGGGVQDENAWPGAMAIYPYPGPIGIPQQWHGLDGTGSGGTGGSSSPSYIPGTPESAIGPGGRGGCGLVQIRYAA